MIKKTLLVFSLAVFLLGFCGCNSSETETPSKVKNVVLLIGDGMGLAQVYAAMSVSVDKLNIERSQYFGYSKTYSASDYTTDSGAGATAIATGTKVKNKSISVDGEGNQLKTINDYANEAGLSTGVVSSCEVFHATPAAFITHDTFRYNSVELAQRIPESDVDLIFGGGYHMLDSVGTLSMLAKKGYDVLRDLSQVDETTTTPVICLPYNEHPPKMQEGRGDFLPKATALALNKLSLNEKGYFLMVEGSQIDWGGHDNDIQYIVNEVIDFDKAVGKAFDFADANPGTLVIVTADHETGGLSLPNGSIENHEIIANFGTTHHTGIMVPVFAYGTGAEKFSSIIENTDIFYKILNALNLSAE